MGEILILEGGNLIDGIRREERKDSLVIIEGNKIIYAGERSGAPAIKGQRWNVSGQTVLPGLIDAHTHLTLPETVNTNQDLVNVSLPALTIQAALFARRTLENGFTTIREVGSIGHIDIFLRNAIQAGQLVGPRIMASGKGISMTGGRGCFPRYPPWVKSEVGSYGEEADGVGAVLAATRRQIDMGADGIKFFATGGACDMTGKMDRQEFSPEEMAAIVGEAHRAGRIVTAHAIGLRGIKAVIAAGVDGVDHAVFADEECLKAMKERRIFLVSTLAFYYRMAHWTGGGEAQFVVENCSRVHQAQMALMARAREWGIDIVVGTDAGGPLTRHGENALELELLTQAGLSPMEAIMASTSVAARTLGLGDRGTIEEGKLADLLVVEGDPLKNIALLQDPQNIKIVMKDGKICARRDRAQ